MSCNLNHVKKSANQCKENPAGVSNYCMVIPFASVYGEQAQDGFIQSVEVEDDKNQYNITFKGSCAAAVAKCYRVDFKNQTGQLTSEDNGPGMANTVTGTGRVEIGIDEMALLSRILSNLDGNFLVFFPTGNKKALTEGGTAVPEWLVVGNPTGDITWSRASDTGQERTSDHGTTFTVVCNFQVYDTVKWYGEISEAE